MKYIDVGGAKVSAVGLGTWQFGSSEWGYGPDYAQRQAGTILNRALDLGITLLDTAEIYGFGRSEKIVGRALEGRRDGVFLATKILPILPIRPVVDHRLQGSLRRLRTDVVDLYQLHQPNPVVPLSQTMPAFAALMDGGRIRHTGVSNYSLARWQRADAALGRPVLSNQVQFSLADRRPEAELVPWAQAQDRLIIAYSPLAQGLLSGRYDVEHRPSGKVRTNSPAFLPENLRRASPLIDAVRRVAVAHGATPSQVALAWLIRRPNVVVIPGASSVAQVEENAAAADLDLSDDDDAALVAAADAYEPLPLREAIPQLARERWEGLRARMGRETEPSAS
ncbi:MAG TPA: aldo/keto reductase [Acidimicrobiales bacterium]|nr:aldo/keto reductase [Acidimicrobiales bacterium]